MTAAALALVLLAAFMHASWNLYAKVAAESLLREDTGPWRLVGAALIVAGVIGLAWPR